MTKALNHSVEIPADVYLWLLANPKSAKKISATIVKRGQLNQSTYLPPNMLGDTIISIDTKNSTCSWINDSDPIANDINQSELVNSVVEFDSTSTKNESLKCAFVSGMLQETRLDNPLMMSESITNAFQSLNTEVEYFNFALQLSYQCQYLMYSASKRYLFAVLCRDMMIRNAVADNSDQGEIDDCISQMEVSFRNLRLNLNIYLFMR